MPLSSLQIARGSEKMTYTELKTYFAAFHRGEMSKIELAMVIGLWQEAGARLD